MIDVKGTSIYLTRGDTLRIQLSITKNGEPYELQDGDIITFSLKKKINDKECILQKTIGADYLLEIEPEETKDLNFGQYIYDIQMEYADGTIDTFITPSNFTLTDEVA